MLNELVARLQAEIDPDHAEQVAKYFGVFPGGYGDGDIILGIPVPTVRKICQDYKQLPVKDALTLLNPTATTFVLRHWWFWAQKQQNNRIRFIGSSWMISNTSITGISSMYLCQRLSDSTVLKITMKVFCIILTARTICGCSAFRLLVI